MDRIGSIKELGYSDIREAELHAILDYLCDLHSPAAHDSSAQLISGIEYPSTILQGGKTGDETADWTTWGHRPLFRHIAKEYTFSRDLDSQTVEPSKSGHKGEDWALLVQSAASPTEATDHVVNAIQQKLAKSLGIPTDDVETQKPIYGFVVDSLLAIGMRYWISKELRADVSIFDIMGNKTNLLQLGDLVRSSMLVWTSAETKHKA
ncbi:MAG: hypothetical protein LQ340_002554 [Diploschistes diacapsis]|nr:MAG: hypothetical protein LQ340_002554 [Diploschistes diacapsis]